MAIMFYYASGSPYAWRVWLALERKFLPYKMETLSFSAGDLRKPEFLALNPRHQIPVINDDGFVLYESAAIMEYLDDAYGAIGGPLFPRATQPRALARRLIREADEYLARALEDMVSEILFKPAQESDGDAILRAREIFIGELGHFEHEIKGDFFMEQVGAVDFTLYPIIALALRLELKKSDLMIRTAIGQKINAWMGRVESLPYFQKTYPPHWRVS
jgi:glutathione S-transferase